MSNRPTPREALPQIEIWDQPEHLHAFQRDESFAGALPLAVAFPRSTQEVAEVMRYAHQHKLPVVPRGAGTGLAGAAVPLDHVLILSLEKMNRILAIDWERQVAIVEPGVITGQIRDAAEAEGLFYPPIPASVDSCTIGGNISTNAGGLCAVKYGVTREYVLALEVVLADGSIIRTGAPLAKNSTGYNLTQLIVGSEGTLGVVTQITLKLLPQPRERITLLAGFSSLTTVSQAVLRILQAQVLPPTLELLPQGAVRCVLDRHPELSYPFPDMAASLLIELDGRESAHLEHDLEKLESVLTQVGAQELRVATTASQRNLLWQVRKLVRDSIASSGDFVEADSVVPRPSLPHLVAAAQEVAKIAGLEVICYGHAGDGNLHTYFRRNRLPEEVWKIKSARALKLFFEKTVELGGMISGEHGIGFLKRDFLPMVFSPTEIELMKQIKRAFDPHDLLNPGKIFPA